ncbi:MAG: zinc ribbon domain-containing protein [Candidatus Hodarchaeota archaeon]
MKDSNILIIELVASGFLLFFGVYFLFTIPYAMLNTGMLGIPVLMMIGAGMFLVIASPIIFFVKNVRRKRLNLISQSDVTKMFECPQCGTMGATSLIKLVKDQILIKQRCPTHGTRLFRLPIRLKDHTVSYFRKTILRCFKCGQVATEAHVKFSGPWTLISLTCPTHGIHLPYHKIWSTVYEEIFKDVVTEPQQTQLRRVSSEKNIFCPNCGEKFLSEDQIVCQSCGLKR